MTMTEPQSPQPTPSPEPSSPTGDLGPPESAADEKVTLLTFLDYLREALIRKVEGVPDEVGRAAAVPSGTSLFWLLKHLAAVEFNWFVWSYRGLDVPLWDDEAAVGPGEDRERLIRAYRDAVGRANAVIAACDDLDRPGVRSVRDTAPPNMRWLLVHMIEETARHAGHADIIRELHDGATGR